MSALDCSMLRRLPVVITVTLLMAGCRTAGPDYSPTALSGTPDTWSGWHSGSAELHNPNLRQSGPSLTMLEGFALFSDPLLTALQEQALAQNQDLQIALLRLTQSRLQRQATAAQDELRLTARGSAGRQRQSETGSATRLLSVIAPPDERGRLIDFLSQPFSLFQGGFDASWELDLWGRVERGLEAADARTDLAGAQLQQVQLTLLAEVARNYFEWRGVNSQLALLEGSIDRGRVSLELIASRQAGGMTSDLERAAQAARVSALQASRPPLLAQQARLLSTLGALLGMLPGEVEQTLTDAGPWQPVDLPDLALGLPSDLAQTRPDILAAEARLRESTALIGLAEAELYPRITLGAGLNLESLEAQELAQWGSRQWSLGPSFLLPVFDQQQRRTQVELRELQQQEAAIAYQQTVLKAWHEIDLALSAYTAESLRHDQLTSQWQADLEALELARISFDNGLTSYLGVLGLEPAATQTRQQILESETRLAVNLVTVFKALGRATPADLLRVSALSPGQAGP